MSARRVLVTGAADGLGRLAARALVEQGHQVVVHARSPARARQALAAVPGAAGSVHGDLARLAQTRRLAEQLNELPRCDAIIHNAAVGPREPRRVITEDGLEHVFQINVLAPFLLTALVTAPQRLIYLSSGLHRSGSVAALDDLEWERRPWNGTQAYSDSKLFDVILSAGVAQRWPAVSVNTVAPGWVATKMGGAGAPDDLTLGAVTQVWLAVSDEPAATGSGGYFYHQRREATHPAAQEPAVQDRLLQRCATLTGIELPAG